MARQDLRTGTGNGRTYVEERWAEACMGGKKACI